MSKVETLPIYEARGYHVVADIVGVSPQRCLDLDWALPHLEKAAQLAGGRIVEKLQKKYQATSEGYSVVLVLAESHLSIHTHPDKGLVVFDTFMCGHHARPKAALKYLAEVFKGQAINVAELVRDPQWGLGDSSNSLFQVGQAGFNQHLICEMIEVPQALCLDSNKLSAYLAKTLDAMGVHEISSKMKSFGESYGFSGAILIDKGHLTVHTWPEHRFIALDFYIPNCSTSFDLATSSLALTGCSFSDVAVLLRGVRS